MSLLDLCERGRSEEAIQLIAEGIDLSITDASWGNRTALHLACEFGREQIVRALLERIRQYSEADQLSVLNARTSNNRTPLHFACDSDDTECARLLVSAGADVAAIAQDGSTALHFLAYNENMETAQVVLDSLPEQSKQEIINAPNRNGMTALHILCSKRPAQSIKRRPAQEASQSPRRLGHAKGVKGNKVPLFFTQARLSSPQLESGSDLDLAAKFVSLLLRHGADPARVDTNGNTALHCACSRGNISVLRVLLDLPQERMNRECLDQRNSHGLTALQLASLHGFELCRQHLLAIGAFDYAKPNQLQSRQDSSGESDSEYDDAKEPAAGADPTRQVQRPSAKAKATSNCLIL